jgi:hypothetical protein
VDSYGHCIAHNGHLVQVDHLAIGQKPKVCMEKFDTSSDWSADVLGTFDDLVDAFAQLRTKLQTLGFAGENLGKRTLLCFRA